MIKKMDGLKRYTIINEYGLTTIHEAGETFDYCKVLDYVESHFELKDQNKLTHKILVGVIKKHGIKALKYENDIYISNGRLEDFDYGIYQKTDIMDIFTKRRIKEELRILQNK